MANNSQWVGTSISDFCTEQQGAHSIPLRLLCTSLILSVLFLQGCVRSCAPILKMSSQLFLPRLLNLLPSNRLRGNMGGMLLQLQTWGGVIPQIMFQLIICILQHFLLYVYIFICMFVCVYRHVNVCGFVHLEVMATFSD